MPVTNLAPLVCSVQEWSVAILPYGDVLAHPNSSLAELAQDRLTLTFAGTPLRTA